MFRKRSIDTLASADGVCQTCHAVWNGVVSGVSKGWSGGVPSGTTATRAAYKNGDDSGSNDPGAMHPRGADPGGTSYPNMTRSGYTDGSVPATDSTEDSATGTSSGTGGGLYCGSCHTAHGDSGQLVNNWTVADNENDPISWNPAGVESWKDGYLHFDAVNSVWQACTAPDGVTGCEDLVVDSAAGEAAYLYGYKLLTASPNHAYGPTQPWGATRPKTFNAADNASDVMPWCQTCHVSKSETKIVGDVRVADDTKHMHPTGCTACHGNPSTLGVGEYNDFPHTSVNEVFLKDYPDGLCLSCHISGSLP